MRPLRQRQGRSTVRSLARLRSARRRSYRADAEGRDAGRDRGRARGARRSAPDRTLRARPGCLHNTPARARGRRCAMSKRTISPELVRALKRLCLGKILEALPERLVLADEQGLPFEDVLLLLLTDEIERRDGGAAQRRSAKAGLHPDMVLERWDRTAKVHFD